MGYSAQNIILNPGQLGAPDSNVPRYQMAPLTYL